MVALITAILGGIVGSVLTNWFTEHRDRKKEFHDAGKQFREAFLEVEYLLSIRHPEHSKIYSGSDVEYEKVFPLLCRFHRQHYLSLVRFEPYLSKREAEKLRKLWEEYCCFDSSPTQQYATYQDYKSTEAMEEEWSKRELALHRIQEMFTYTR